MHEDHQFGTSPAIVEKLALLTKPPYFRNVTWNPDWIVLKPIFNMILSISRTFCGLTEIKFKFWPQRFHPCLERGWSSIPSEEYHPTMKLGGGNILFWGFFAYSGTEELEIIDSPMKSAKYDENLKYCLQSSIQKLIHTAQLTCAWFQDNKIKVM